MFQNLIGKFSLDNQELTGIINARDVRRLTVLFLHSPGHNFFLKKKRFNAFAVNNFKVTTVFPFGGENASSQQVVNSTLNSPAQLWKRIFFFNGVK